MFTSKVVTTIIAGAIGAAMAIAFLGFLAVKIGELPFIIIVFTILAAMLWDFFDTMRETYRNAGVSNGQNHDNNNS